MKIGELKKIDSSGRGSGGFGGRRREVRVEKQVIKRA